MKKIFKIIVIIVIVIVVLIGAVFGYTKIKQSMMNNERRNTMTLMEYIKTHESPVLYFVSKELKCDALDNIKLLTSDRLITKDNEIYDISFDKLFSNNQNCKKIETNINISNIRDGFIFSKDNKFYNISDFEEVGIADYLQIYLLDKNIIKIIESDYDEINGKINLLVFKNNNIYKQTYNITNGENGFNKITFEKEELYKSLEEYGNIKHITFEPHLYTNSDKNIQLWKSTIKTIISDKGYYYLNEVKTDECTKYVDIECEFELKESETYKRFSKDIKFLGETFTVLSDNSIVETSIFRKNLKY